MATSTHSHLQTRRREHPISRLIAANNAFMVLGWRQAISYPLGFVMTQLSNFVPIFVFYFVATQVNNPSQGFGSDYFTSVVIGLLGVKILDTGLRGFGLQMDMAINRGWLEMFLVEPVRWRYLPIAMSQWPVAQGLFAVVTTIGITILLGADFNPSGIPLALLIGALGLIAGLAIGTLSAAVKVLAKSGDPILHLYTLAAQIFSGVYFPINDLPEPLRLLSYLLPHTYVIQGLRRVLAPGDFATGLSTPTLIWTLVIFSALAYPFAIWVWGRSLNYGRQLGVLSGY